MEKYTTVIYYEIQYMSCQLPLNFYYKVSILFKTMQTKKSIRLCKFTFRHELEQKFITSLSDCTETMLWASELHTQFHDRKMNASDCTRSGVSKLQACQHGTREESNNSWQYKCNYMKLNTSQNFLHSVVVNYRDK